MYVLNGGRDVFGKTLGVIRMHRNFIHGKSTREIAGVVVYAIALCLDHYATHTQ